MSRDAVLILTPDLLAAALFGAAVELAGHRPHFAQDGEHGREALRRTRPRIVVVDCDHDAFCDDALIGPAMMTGARVILVHSHRGSRDPRTLGVAHDLPVLTLPGDADRLVSLLRGRP